MGSKDISASDSTTKKIKGETPPNQSKTENSKSSPRDGMSIENTRSEHHYVTHTSTSAMPIHEPLKPSFRLQAPIGTPFAANRFKLDNRPTVFKVVPPLPSDLANVSYTPLSIYPTYFCLKDTFLFPSFLVRCTDQMVIDACSKCIFVFEWWKFIIFF